MINDITGAQAPQQHTTQRVDSVAVAQIARCDREIMEASAYSGPDGFLALLGEMDWRVERDLLIKDRKKNVVERESAA